MTPAATPHFGPEFSLEPPLHLAVRVARFEERDELFGSVTPNHMEGEVTAVLAANFAS